jgi:hypothetical protein
VLFGNLAQRPAPDAVRAERQDRLPAIPDETALGINSVRTARVTEVLVEALRRAGQIGI